jgi:hypothetical protein
MDEWQQGYDDAVAYCRANYKPFKRVELPAQFVHRGSSWSRGFGEGMLTTKNKIIDEAYPGNVGFSVASDGKVTVFYPQGHKALNKDS